MERIFSGRDPEVLYNDGTFKVIKASSDEELDLFKRLQYEPYRNDPNRTPRLPGFFELLFSPENPIWRHERAEALFLYKRGEPIGTIVVAMDDRLNEKYGKKLGLFGFLELVDLSGFGPLIKAAEGLLKDRGAEEIRGPINLSMEYNAGFLLYPHDEPAPIFVNYTRKEYPELMEKAGYKKLIDLIGLEINLTKIPKEAFEKPRRVLQEYRFEHARKRDREHYLEIILELTLDAFKDHRAFAKKDYDDLFYVFYPFKNLADERMIRIAFDGDEPIGYTVRAPDLGPCLRKVKERIVRGKLGILGLLSIRRCMRKLDRAKSIASGVKEGYRRRGIGSTLNYLAILRMLERGMRRFNYSRIVETNEASIRNGKRRGAVEKEKRRVYMKALKRNFSHNLTSPIRL